MQAEWCNLMSTVYAKHHGVVNMTATGPEALAQINAETATPRSATSGFGGTGDPHLQAAEQGLTLEYKSPNSKTCTPWAQKLGG